VTALPWIIVLCCVCTQAFFAVSELSILSANGIRLQEAARGGDAAAARVLWFRDHPDRLFGTTLLGTNVSTVTASTVASLALIARFGDAGSWLALAVMSPLVLLGAEIIPKSIAQAQATRLAPRMARALYTVHLVLGLPVYLIRSYTRLLYRLTGIEAGGRTVVSREDLMLLMTGDQPEGEIDADEREMISRIFAFSHLRARDVMIPLVDVCAVHEDDTVREAAALVAERGYSRLPVYRERVDDMIGLLHHIDLLAADDGDRPVKTLARQPHFVPEGQEIDDLLVILQRSAASAAFVVDEFGGVVGLITLEDILEEIVGDIDDEFDHGEGTGLWRRAPGGEGWIVNARAPVEKLNQVFGLGLPESEEYETLAGFLLDHLKHIPQRGENLSTPEGIRLTIHRASDRAIEEVLIAGRMRSPRDSRAR
jgi:CBS domain containing-hemolysin-like protein